MKKRIVLTGFMGSGKSIIGQLLAEKLNYEYQDLDTAIEVIEKNNVSGIFAEMGELYFRLIEKQTLSEILNPDNQSIVLSTGGGTPCYYNNLDVIKANAFNIFLDVNAAILKDRLAPEKEKRPMITNITDVNLLDFIDKKIEERRPFYEKCDFIYKITENKNPEQIVNELLSILQSR